MSTESRRSFFAHVAGGVYGAALASLLDCDLYGDEPAHERDAAPSRLVDET